MSKEFLGVIATGAKGGNQGKLSCVSLIASLEVWFTFEEGTLAEEQMFGELEGM